MSYRPVIEDNASFFAHISPVLQAQQGIGYDIVVFTDGWELTQMIANRWLIPLDHSKLPNFARYAGPIAKKPVFDPKNTYTVTWQAGLTGIGYDPRATGREISSVHDLFDPAFKGKVGMMSDDTELGSAGLLAAGSRPGEVHAGRLEEGGGHPDQAAGRRHRPPVLRPELHQGAGGRRHLDLPGLVRRHLPG